MRKPLWGRRYLTWVSKTEEHFIGDRKWESGGGAGRKPQTQWSSFEDCLIVVAEAGRKQIGHRSCQSQNWFLRHIVMRQTLQRGSAGWVWPCQDTLLPGNKTQQCEKGADSHQHSGVRQLSPQPHDEEEPGPWLWVGSCRQGHQEIHPSKVTSEIKWNKSKQNSNPIIWIPKSITQALHGSSALNLRYRKEEDA